MLLYVKIKPNQRFERIERTGNEWVVRIHAPAVDGRANERLVEYLSEILGIGRSGISIKKGLTSRQKCLEIKAGEEEVLRKLAEITGGLHRPL